MNQVHSVPQRCVPGSDIASKICQADCVPQYLVQYFDFILSKCRFNNNLRVIRRYLWNVIAARLGRWSDEILIGGGPLDLNLRTSDKAVTTTRKSDNAASGIPADDCVKGVQSLVHK
jgi:hypothetical protein